MSKQYQLQDFINDELFRRRVIIRTGVGVPVLILFGSIIRYFISPILPLTLIGIGISILLFLTSAYIIKIDGKTKTAALLMLSGIFLIISQCGHW